MLITRARPLLGTVVTLQAVANTGCEPMVAHAIAQALLTMAHISRVMSAHDASSDLGRLAHAKCGEVLTLDAQTVHVIHAAQFWTRVSAGAFNPCRAAQTLSSAGRRPGLAGDALGDLNDMVFLSDTDVRLTRPVKLDLGGIAKGYAVDCAMSVLAAHGVHDALVNAGGDLRGMGQRKWPIDVRHAKHTLMDARLRRVRSVQQHALATSVAGARNPEFVAARAHQTPRWQSVTVQADTCLAADALTKWALQSSLLCPRLREALRLNRGQMWRTK
jgi:thiamine biosynthesis lipoprotein